MLRTALLAAAGWLATTAAASALAFTYSYRGHELVQTDTDQYPRTWPAFKGTMTLDEEKTPGGTLRDVTISFSFGEPYSEFDTCNLDPYLKPVRCGAQLNGLMWFDIFTGFWNYGTSFTFTTDANRRIVSWHGNILGGPPDGASSDRGDSVTLPFDPFATYTAPPGTWSGPNAFAVPLPGAAGLLAAALGLLGALRLHRRA